MSYDVAIEAMNNMLPAETVSETGLILSGAVGSTLTGLNHDSSDVDRMLLFAYSPEATMRAMVGANNTKDSFFQPDPDVFGYEAVKITSLLMKSNPPILNFLHSDVNHFEFTTPLGLEIAELTKTRLLTLDALLRVIPASAIASAKESEFNARNAGDAVNDSMLVKDTPKNVARKLKVAFVLLTQTKQAVVSGAYTPKIENRNWFLEDYPSMNYAEAVSLFYDEVTKVKALDASKLPFKAIFDDSDVNLMRDWVVRAKKSINK